MPAASITSVRSDRVTSVRRLHDRSGRRKSGRFVVEGPQAVQAAVDAGANIQEVFIDVEASPAILAMASVVPSPVTWVTPGVVQAMSETTTPQGIIAVCAMPEPMPIEEALRRSGPVVILDGVSDPGNVGTMIRTAHAAGAACVLLTPGCADPFNGKVVRATAGSIFGLPVLPDLAISTIVPHVKAARRALAVTSGGADEDLFNAVAARLVCPRTCWVIGSEAHGVSQEALEAAHVSVRIPMLAGPESLNAAAALAIVLYVTAYERGMFQSPTPESGVGEPGPAGEG